MMQQEPNPLSMLLSRAMLKRHPVYASMELTYHCNLHCRFCYNPVQRKGQVRKKPLPKSSSVTLSFEEILQVMDQLRELGVLYLTLTGGEAMVHPRFWEIAQEAKVRAFALRIFTNGVLIDEGNATRLEELCPYCVEISIHGSKDSTAQALNQVPGSHEKLMRGLSLLRQKKIRVFLKCVVTRYVENELDEIQAIADSFGFPLYFDPILTPSDDGEDYPLELCASDDALRYLYSNPRFHVGVSPFERQPGEMNCSVAMGTLNIDPFGNVSPCIQWKENIGNIREKSLKEIWETSRELERIKEINLRVNRSLMESTADHAFCAHCPGLSLLRYGDPLRPEEQYLRVARIRKEVYESQKQGQNKGFLTAV